MEEQEDGGAVSSLIAMAEHFLSLKPKPPVKEAAQCLMAALSLAPPPRVEARARLELGLLLFHHTHNLSEAKEHLDKAVSALPSYPHTIYMYM